MAGVRPWLAGALALGSLAVPLAGWGSPGHFELPPPSPAALELRAERLMNWALYAALSVGVPLLALYSGAAARLRDVLGRLPLPGWAAAMLFFVVYEITVAVLLTPVWWHRGFGLLQAHGLYAASGHEWLQDRLSRAAIGALLVAPIVAAGYWLMARRPRDWWLVLGAINAPYVVAMALVYPHFIAPLLTPTAPLPEGPLRERIEAMAAEAGIPAAAIMVEATSDKSPSLNAHVTGFGGGVKIAFTDHLLETLSTEEVLDVLAHEVGHHVLGHVWMAVAAGIALAFLALWLLARLGPWLVARHGARWRIRSFQDYATIPLVMLFVAVGGIALEPVANAVSRWSELQANVFALRMTGDRLACAGVVRKLQVNGLSVPDPDALEHAIRGTHPTLAEQMALCRDGRIPAPPAEAESLGPRQHEG